MQRIAYTLFIITCIAIIGCVVYDPTANSDKEPFHCQYDESTASIDTLDSACNPDDQAQTGIPTCYLDSACSSGLRSCTSLSCIINPQTDCGNAVARSQSFCATQISGTITCYVNPACGSVANGCATNTCMSTLTTCNNFIGMSSSYCYEYY